MKSGTEHSRDYVSLKVLLNKSTMTHRLVAFLCLSLFLSSGSYDSILFASALASPQLSFMTRTTPNNRTQQISRIVPNPQFLQFLSTVSTKSPAVSATDLCLLPENACVYGVCEMLSGGQQGTVCRCPAGRSGAACQEEEPAVAARRTCAHNPCLANGTCFLTPGSSRGFLCECLTGFTGFLCETVLQCSPPCTHGKVCADAVNNICLSPQQARNFTNNDDNLSNAVQSNDLSGLEDLQFSFPSTNSQSSDGAAVATASRLQIPPQHPRGATTPARISPTATTGTFASEICRRANCPALTRCISVSTIFTCKPLNASLGTVAATALSTAPEADLLSTRASSDITLPSVQTPTAQGQSGNFGLSNNTRHHQNPRSNSTARNNSTRNFSTALNVVQNSATRPRSQSSVVVEQSQPPASDQQAALKHDSVCVLTINGSSYSICQNGGTCVDDQSKPHGFVCKCSQGYSGLMCETVLQFSFCETYRPCHFGLCVNRDNVGYQCFCKSGYTGVNCSQKLDQCAGSPCRNNGQCIQTADSEPNSNFPYKCLCQPPFTGRFCETVLSGCSSSPCLNNGFCLQHLFNYECKCQPGFHGLLCEQPANQSKPAITGQRSTFATTQTIVEASGQTMSVPVFETTAAAAVQDPCASNPCEATSKCISRQNERYDCVSTQTCTDNPCLNNGTCFDVDSVLTSFICSCLPQFSGPFCETFLLPPPFLSAHSFSQTSQQQPQQEENEQQAFPSSVTIPTPPEFRRVNDAKPLKANVLATPAPFPFRQEEHRIFDICSNNANLCNAGRCIELSNGSYSCDCGSGFAGRHCEVDINECAVSNDSPCLNGAKCLNTFGSYACECLSNFAGRSCEIALQGCDNEPCPSNATCRPFIASDSGLHSFECKCSPGHWGSSCERETTASFNGQSLLAIVTSASQAVYQLSLRFRTTVSDVYLATGDDILSTNVYRLEISNGHLHLHWGISTDGRQTNANNRQSLSLGDRLNDGAWHGVTIIQDYDTVTLQLFDANVRLVEMRSLAMRNPKPLPIFNTKFGGLNLNWQLSSFRAAAVDGPHGAAGMMHNFVGCMQDMSVNNQTIVPAEQTRNSVNIQLGCKRTVRCRNSTCSGNGMCKDLWTSFRCECKRPFLEPDCSKSIQGATFGHERNQSFAEVIMNATEKTSVEQVTDLSMLLMTKAGEGQLAYLGSEASQHAEMETFLALELFEGKLRVTVKLGQNVQTFQGGPRLNDGQLHLVLVSRYENSLNAFVDDQLAFSAELEHPFPHPLLADHFFIAGTPALNLRSKKLSQPLQREEHPRHSNSVTSNKPNSQATFQQQQPRSLERATNEYSTLPVEIHRPKRQQQLQQLNNQRQHHAKGFTASGSDLLQASPAPPVAISPLAFSTIVGFKGFLQDLRINDKFVLFWPSQQSVIEGSFGNVRLSSDVLPDIVSDDLCNGSAASPCANNGVCKNTFNDFQCTCAENFRGKNCSEPNFCSIFKCPASGSFACRNLDENFVCLTEVTLRKESKSEFVPSGIPLHIPFHSVSFEIRTRDDNGLILYAGSSSSFVTLELYENTLMLSYKLGTRMDVELQSIASNLSISDGNWHHVIISLHSESVMASIDNTDIVLSSIREDQKPQVALSQLFFAENATLHVGQVSSKAFGNSSNRIHSRHSFKGCLRSLEVGNYPVQFITPDQLKANPEYGGAGKFLAKRMTAVRLGCHGDDVCSTALANNFQLTSELSIFPEQLVSNRSVCMNNGSCIDLWNSFNCLCPKGFAGLYCEVNIDECLNNSCAKGSSCIDQINGYTCLCQPGYTGQFCDVDANNCASVPCKHNSTCIDKLNGFHCVCPADYTGPTCDISASVDCTSQPCYNGGRCVDVQLTATRKTFECHCVNGYTGTLCETEIDYCDSKPCLPPATCISRAQQQSFVCQCPAGYTGAHCDINIDECLNNPCVHGRCQDEIGNFSCFCEVGWEGHLCDLDRDECALLPCQNEAVCVNTPGSFTCRCPPFYFGSTCEQKGTCLEQPCVRGSCNQTVANAHTCECPKGFKGDRCETEIDFCSPNQCKNNATCRNTQPGFQCVCPAGFEGELCEADYNECSSQPCQHNGLCTDLVNSFRCDCTNSGYKGSECEEDLDECTEGLHNCQHGDCVNSLGSFNCACAFGWLGPKCDLNDPCKANDTHSCQNNGRCVNARFSRESRRVEHDCVCPSSFSGSLCEIRQEPRKAAGVPLEYIVGPLIGALLLLIFAGLVAFAMIAKQKRATRGAYSPSRQEMNGARLPPGPMLKPPLQERLI